MQGNGRAITRSDQSSHRPDAGAPLGRFGPGLAVLIVGVFLWWIFNPLRWWLPHPTGDRSPGTTVGMVEHDAPRGALVARG
jgi:hypothetical protein